ncbi:MAG: class I tRNA ligase family protein, partial [Spirochaetia bacterium]|nr:class I tRNA ligase family protein [Spirochaetia bacterium]
LVWNDFCDWYVEIVKVRLQSEDAAEKRLAVARSLGFYMEILRLIHPLMPFVSEELWSKLGGEGLLMRADFPKEQKLSADEEKTIRRFSLIQDLVSAIRSFRANYQVPHKDKLKAHFLAKDAVSGELIGLSRGMILRLAGLESFEAATVKPAGHASLLNDSAEIFLDARAYRDNDKEKARLNKELEAVVLELTGVEKRLSNQGFVAKAKPEVIEKEKEKQKSLGEKRTKLESELNELA